MQNYTVKRYNKEDYNHWNEFVANAKNSTFLFHRDFMEYHQDRFQDFSLIVLDGKKWMAILPANISDNEVHSHQGLTYGGLVLLPNSKMNSTIFIFKSILKFLAENGIDKLFLKQIPSIYCRFPSDEINYLSHICKAKTMMKHNISVISLQEKNEISRIRKRGIEKGKMNNLEIRQEADIKVFWNNLLVPNLKEKYNAKPVHSLEEISSLMQKFPENIEHFNIYYNDFIVAGITIFVNKNVAKSQYISSTSVGDKIGSLDFLINSILQKYKETKTYFDFGPSHQNDGTRIIESLNYFKESFGSHSLIQDFYEIETKNYPLLDKILI